MSYYWHNTTQNSYNHNDMHDFIETMCVIGDTIKFSERGNALIIDLKTLKEDEYNEYEEIKKEFLSYYNEFHNKNFY